MASLGSRLMSLLGREWRRFTPPPPEHVTTVFPGPDPFPWRWECLACPSLGFGFDQPAVEESAQRHTKKAKITKR